MSVALPLAFSSTCLKPGISPRATGPDDDNDNEADDECVAKSDIELAKTQWTNGVGWPVAEHEMEAPVSLFSSNLLGGSTVNQGPSTATDHPPTAEVLAIAPPGDKRVLIWLVNNNNNKRRNATSIRNKSFSLVFTADDPHTETRWDLYSRARNCWHISLSFGAINLWEIPKLVRASERVKMRVLQQLGSAVPSCYCCCRRPSLQRHPPHVHVWWSNALLTSPPDIQLPD